MTESKVLEAYAHRHCEPLPMTLDELAQTLAEIVDEICDEENETIALTVRSFKDRHAIVNVIIDPTDPDRDGFMTIIRIRKERKKHE